MFYKRGACKQSFKDRNWHRIINVLDYGVCGRRGEESMVGHRRGKQARMERGAGLTEGESHSEPMHSNIFMVKPM